MKKKINSEESIRTVTKPKKKRMVVSSGASNQDINQKNAEKKALTRKTLNSRRDKKKSKAKHILTPSDVSSGTVGEIRVTAGTNEMRRSPIVHTATLIIQTARISGLTFVVFGAVLALLNLNSFSLPQSSQSAQVINTNSTINQKPEVSFLIDGGDILSGIRNISVTVLGAQSVTLYAHNLQSNDYKIIGTGKRVTDLVWNIEWYTTNFIDGSYTIRAVVSNTYGTYTAIDTHTYSVLNQPIQSDVNLSSTTDSTVASTTSDVILKTEVTHMSTFTILDTSPLHEVVPLQLKAENVKSVKLSARNSDASSGSFIGYATLIERNTWTLYWNTKLHTNGFYKVTARIVYENGDIEEKLVETQIFNDTKLVEEHTTASTSESSIMTTDVTSLAEKIKLNVYYDNPLHDSVSVLVTAPDAEYVELFAIPKNSLSKKYVGSAKNMFGSEWKFEWDTTQIPNGSYDLFTHVRHPLGDIESKTVPVSVFNRTKYVVPDEKVAYVETIKAPESEKRVTAPMSAVVQTSFGSQTETVAQEIVASTSITNSDFDDTIANFNQKLSLEIDAYAHALRKGDVAERDAVLIKVNALVATTVTEFESVSTDTEMIERLKSTLDNEIKEQESNAIRSESLIKERIGDTVYNDSDKDEISDYDEVNLYFTDPFVADTDNDGFTDSIEIKTGKNPKNSSSESVIAYTSPKETGVNRSDVLSIKAITVIEETSKDTGTRNVKKALIQGVGLPNSFVTLFIYSTPIIVTVRTDETGSWSYIFDKELDDGTHEIYAGITDNAGRVVAKSDSFGFIKTAEAFSPIDASKETATVSAPQEPTLFSGKALLVIASVAIVAIGLVLILLGLYVGTRQKTIVESND